MGLGRKNLVYSLILAGVMMLFLLGYFIYMLPSLYVDAMMEQNLKSVREQHNSYVQNGTYEGVAVKNPVACFSLKIPFAGDKVLVTGKSFSAEIIVKDARLYQVFECCREKMKVASDLQSVDLSKEMDEVSSIFKEAMQDHLSLPVEMRLLHQWDGEEFFNEATKVHVYSDHMFILEASVEDSANRYTNYIAMEQGTDSLIFTYLPVVAPDINEIRPTVLRSLPMLGTVILFIVLLFSQVYSKGIVAPIVELVRRAEEMKHALGSVESFGEKHISRKNLRNAISQVASDAVLDRQENGNAGVRKYGREDGQEGEYVRGGRRKESQENKYVRGGRREESQENKYVRDGRRKESQENKYVRGGRRENKQGNGHVRAGVNERDEMRELAVTLEDFYRQIRENLCMLEEKNSELAEENKRQEIFLRASSHQLKTPIAAALLLVEGMINEVGRYKDTKMYLPKVKEQLLSMRKIVEDILYLNHCTENMHLQQIEPEKLLKEKLQSYQIPIMEKELSIEMAGEGNLKICTDEMVFSQILDNLLSNGVKYTPAGGMVRITTSQISKDERRGEIRIENFGVTIPDELLPHIFDPFVSGMNGIGDLGTHSHGLGLYIASYYAKKLGLSLTVRNGDACVIASLLVSVL